MTDQPTNRSIASVEASLFGPLFGFHKRVVTLLRKSGLDDENLKVVADRLSALLAAVTGEVTRTPQINLTQRLDAAFDEVKRLVDHLSGPPAGDKAKGAERGSGEAHDGVEGR